MNTNIPCNDEIIRITFLSPISFLNPCKIFPPNPIARSIMKNRAARIHNCVAVLYGEYAGVEFLI